MQHQRALNNGIRRWGNYEAGYGGGGNCVKIKHNKTYQTVYAHMKNFSNLAIPGNRVKQGQIIGYVGSTGLSTGHIYIMK